ncbi:FkbM family methyltransferase [Nostoc sp. CHAB 5834]|nr:FkbM family methyltransferase [Nostoc sp. CHAB 5834]
MNIDKNQKFDSTGEIRIIENFIGDKNIVFDIGANVGSWSKTVLQKHDQVQIHLFEPVPDNYNKLNNNLVDWLEKENIHPNKIAVANHENTQTFYYYEDNPASSTFYRRFHVEKQYSLKPPIELPVVTTTIDKYCQQLQINRINFLKINTEGGELDVLYGVKELLTKGKIDYIQFEYGGTFQDASITLKQVFNYLQSFRYCLLKIEVKKLIYIPEFLPEYENFEYSNYLAINERFKSAILGQKPQMLPLQELCASNSVKPRGVIHIGAHEGQELSDYLAMGVEKILYIEANPIVFERLQKNIANYPNVQAVCCAIGNENGTVTLHITSMDQSSSILPLKVSSEIYPMIKETEQITVPCKTIDSLLEELNLNPADFNILNIDIQGAELLALQGGTKTLKYIEAINTEVNYEELYAGCALIDEIDDFLETYDFERIATTTPYHPSWGDAFYTKKAIITMSTFGKNGRFANQIFQYAFLKIYAQEHNLRVEIPSWIGQTIFGHNDPPISQLLPVFPEITNNIKDAIIPNTAQVFKNVDFWGYFQYNARYYAPHKEYFRSLFEPVAEIKTKLEEAVKNLRNKGKTVIGIHLRRGDYGYQHFFIAPSQWYLEWLENIWPTLDEPVLFIASDEIGKVKQDFSQYNPVTTRDLNCELEQADFYPDFYLLSKCDILAISNSSFSFAAAILNEEGKLFMRPHLPSKKLITFDPWSAETVFLDAKIEHYQRQKSDIKSDLTTPVGFFIFNRPETTARVFEAIRQAKPLKLLVVADGARADKLGEAEKCAATRAIINQVDWECEVLTNYSDVNLGCRKRISSGLDWIFEQVEEAIILEDDCLPHPTFFRYCQELLEKYRDDQQIMMISGDNFQFGSNRTEYSYYFSRYGHCWGWASWRRAWTKYDDSMQLWTELRDNNWLNEVLQNEQAVAYWSKIFQAVNNGFNTWDYIWQYTLWINNALTILPNINLVSNIGFGSGTHTTTDNNKLANMTVEAVNFPLKHPLFVIRNTQADNFTEETIFSSVANKMKFHPEYYICLEEIVTKTNNNQNEVVLDLIYSSLREYNAINYVKAVALARQGKITEALATLETLLNHTPAHTKGITLRKELRKNLDSDKIAVHPLIEKANRLLEENQIAGCFEILNDAKALKQPIMGLDFLRAKCFLQMRQPAASIQSLHEELRYFPENNQAENFLNQLLTQYPQLVSHNIQDSEFQEIYRLIQPYTMLSEARLYSLFTLIKRICVENIPGNFVECGVAAGGSTALVAAVIKRHTRQPRWVYAFDSFDGMPAPTEKDKSNGILAEVTGWGTGTCAAPEASVKEVCNKLGVGDIVQLVKGYFEDTLPKMRDAVGMIAFLHMDGDWYESTKTIINNFYDHISNDGFVQVDDYGFWEGCRQALHEFEAERQLKFELHQIDSTGVWFNCPHKFAINPVFENSLIEEFDQDDPVKYGIQSQMSKNERFQLYYAARKLLPTNSSPCRFVEIGSFAGSSLFLNQKALIREHNDLEGWAIDPGLHPQLKLVLDNLPSKITHLRMFSHDALAQLQTIFERDRNYPPYIFVDGDHSYEGVKKDIANYYPLLAPGGLMIFHDYLPPLDEENSPSILFHHGGNEPGIRQACQELMENTYHCEIIEVPLLYPDDPTQTQAYLPIIPGVFSSLKIYRKPSN